MVHSSDNYTCAVLNVSLTFGQRVEAFWFDLRVRNSSIRGGPTRDCMNYYYRYVGEYRQTSQGLYNSSCQRILTLPTVLNVRLPDLVTTSVNSL
ncbi:hypothetical protein V5799_019463 [Amblyomma americanum]|uniref:Lipocalin n=1 Tax=Amblyomma americanum TaxID=6943 RepID=A0AAQ4EX58_AMBAM